MDRYGQDIDYSTPDAPHPFTGSITGYSLRDAKTRQPIPDEVGDYLAVATHSRKGDLSFDAIVTAGSDDFLDLSLGGAVEVSTLTTGIVLATRAVERWALLQPKTVSLAGTWFPDIEEENPAMAGTNLNVVTPAQPGSIALPGSAVVYSTIGLGSATGVVHELEITQELQITEDEPSPDGKIVGAATHAYMRTISLLLLAKSAAPALDSTLTLTGAPTHAGGYKIDSVEEQWSTMRGKMYRIGAWWIPALS